MRKIYSDPKIPPPVDAEIYVGTAWYLSHGVDDFQGGLVTVNKVETRSNITFVYIKERPGTGYNWECLAPIQLKLAKEFGESRGHPDPDYSAEGNDDSGWHS